MNDEVLCTPRFDLHRSITETILSAIAAGSGEFLMPWHQGGSSVCRPLNAFTEKPYRGVNAVALWAEAALRGFEAGHWATYRQWRLLDAQVRKGEQGAVIVFYKPAEPRQHAEDDEEEAAKPRRIARASWVFNSAQVDGWTAPRAPQENRVEPLDEAERFVKATGADIREQGNRACYSRIGDYIEVPPRSAFVDTETSSPTEAFYATVFHELTHWTGHPSRLDRELSGRFGDRAYATEELVAELGAAFLCADLGVSNVPRPDHAQYINEWYTLLTFDKRAIFVAASKASMAAAYLLRLGAHKDEARQE